MIMSILVDDLLRKLLIICSVYGGRLECTMQNIAENFFNTYPSRSYKNVEGTELS